MTYTKGIQNVP